MGKFFGKIQLHILCLAQSPAPGKMPSAANTAHNLSKGLTRVRAQSPRQGEGTTPRYARACRGPTTHHDGSDGLSGENH